MNGRLLASLPPQPPLPVYFVKSHFYSDWGGRWGHGRTPSDHICDQSLVCSLPHPFCGFHSPFSRLCTDRLQTLPPFSHFFLQKLPRSTPGHLQLPTRRVVLPHLLDETGGGGGLASGWRWAASGGAAEVRFKLETYWLAAHSFIHLVYVYPASSQPFQQPQETAKSLGHYVTLNLSACSFILRSNSSCSSAGDWKPELFPPSKCFHLAWVNTQMARENFHTFQSASKSVSCV